MQGKQAELRRFHKDVEYYQAHRQQLLQQYPEQWVAIFNEQVVGAHPDFERLLDLLDEKSVPSERAFIQRATAKDELLILSLRSAGIFSAQRAEAVRSLTLSWTSPPSTAPWGYPFSWTPVRIGPS